MSQKTEPQSGAEDESGVALIHLTAAVPEKDLPPFLKDRKNATTGARISIEDIQSLNPTEQAQVLEIIERAVVFHREKSGSYRGLANPAERTAKHLEAFLAAARKPSKPDAKKGE